MRLQSEIQFTVKNVVIGGPNPLVCLPLVAKNTPELLEQAEIFKPLSPDLLEWRVDAFDAVESPADCLEALRSLQACIGAIPVIFTCRTHEEGGFKELSKETRLKLITTVAASGLADIVDAEMSNGADFVAAVKKAAAQKGSRLILSYHNFQATPDEEFLHQRLLQGQEMGADITKVAVMPQNYHDVLTLLSATLKARTGEVRIPIVTMAMGEAGGVTRLAGGLFGSDITFAVGKELSAPGQIPIGELKKAMTVLY